MSARSWSGKVKCTKRYQLGRKLSDQARHFRRRGDHHQGHRFTAWKHLDPVRAGKEATDIADEVLALFTDRRIPVKVTIEIQAEQAEGFDETTRRNVTENANTLGFGHHEFE